MEIRKDKKKREKKETALIWKLAKNDFKNRFAGSYLGRVWAFVQPVVTVLLYWFVFDYIMGAKAQLLSAGLDIPYVIWLTAGLVPWFFFTEALNNGTTSLLEYSYLVKKVVFHIDIIPIIKVIAATFTHLFFVGFLLLFYVLLGFDLNIYMIQLPYYTFCMIMLVLALSYTTCALVVFFRDLLQIINIGLQVGMWVTPILWNFDSIGMPEWARVILKLNPMFYVVKGYRNALFEGKWFFEDMTLTCYFWGLTLALFIAGRQIFKRLKVHFADVL